LGYKNKDGAFLLRPAARMRIAPALCQSRVAHAKGDAVPAVGLYRGPQWGEKKKKEKKGALRCLADSEAPPKKREKKKP
jgi:hypothetical protein